MASENTYPGILNRLDEAAPALRGTPSDCACIFFTSGSTADPKGVMLTYDNLFSHLETLTNVFHYNSESILLNNLRLHHVDGLIQGPLLALYNGATLIRPENFTMQNMDFFLNHIASEKVSHFIAVPAMLAIIDRYAEFDDYFTTPFFKMIISTAAYLNTDLWMRLKKRYHTTICNVYGLTETVAGGLFVGPEATDAAIGTVGIPIDMDIRIVDTHHTEQTENEIGELLLKGKNISPGYYGNPQSTEAVFIDNWFYTGDLAKKNKQGFIEIVGRKKEIIISGGFTLYPEEIREILLRHPEVKDAVIVGIENDFLGEIPVAVVEKSDAVSEKILMDFCADHMETEIIPKLILAVPQIPRGSSGKPLLTEIKKIAENATKKSPQENKTTLLESDIISIAAETLMMSVERLSLRSNSAELPNWDSLRHIKLIQVTEEKFNIRFGMRDIIQIKSLKDLFQTAQALITNAK